MQTNTRFFRTSIFHKKFYLNYSSCASSLFISQVMRQDLVILQIKRLDLYSAIYGLRRSTPELIDWDS